MDIIDGSDSVTENLVGWSIGTLHVTLCESIIQFRKDCIGLPRSCNVPLHVLTIHQKPCRSTCVHSQPKGLVLHVMTTWLAMIY